MLVFLLSSCISGWVCISFWSMMVCQRLKNAAYPLAGSVSTPPYCGLNRNSGILRKIPTSLGWIDFNMRRNTLILPFRRLSVFFSSFNGWKEAAPPLLYPYRHTCLSTWVLTYIRPPQTGWRFLFLVGLPGASVEIQTSWGSGCLHTRHAFLFRKTGILLRFPA